MEFREYKVGDIFKNIKTTKHITKANLKEKGKTLVITGGDGNYGVAGYYCVKATDKGNCITFSRTSTMSFYRNEDFTGLDSVAALYHERLTENIAQYLITCFKTNADGYSFGLKRLPERLKNEIISLPSIIHDDGTFEPDWDYMENYIKELKEKVNIYTQTEINIINNVKKHRNEKIDVSEWKEYKMSDLFDISGLKGNKILSNNDVTEKDSIHNIASLGATDENNQIQGYVQSVIFEVGNFISCNVFTGKCFYQKENCVAGSHGLTKIKIKNKILNENISLFLIPLLNKLSNLYNRQHQRSGSVMKNETIKLPSILHDDGTFEPDWDYMENYIKELKGEKYEKHI